MRHNVPTVSDLVFSTNEVPTLMKGIVARIRFCQIFPKYVPAVVFCGHKDYSYFQLFEKFGNNGTNLQISHNSQGFSTQSYL